MKHSVPHDLGQKRAKEITDAMLKAYKVKYPQYQPTGKWLSPSKVSISFKAAGMTVSGVIEVLADRIEVDFDVPFLFRPFRKKTIQVVEAEFKRWIAKSKGKNA
jgi:hypothetical protein